MINILCINCSDGLLERLNEFIDTEQYPITLQDTLTEDFSKYAYNPIILGANNSVEDILKYVQLIRKTRTGLNRIVCIENYDDLDFEDKYNFKLLDTYNIDIDTISASNIKNMLEAAKRENTNVERIMYEYF